MRVIIDTNVVMSGIFFKGLPNKLLTLWQNGNIVIVATKQILEEYSRVSDELSKKLQSDGLNKILTSLMLNSELVMPIELEKQVCDDKDDDKFIECALGGNVKTIITGD